jgi:hypothetical protein
MSTISCEDLTQHIIEHEIIGFTSQTVSGVDANITIEDDNVFVVSGVNTINFADGLKATDAGGGQADVELFKLKVDGDNLWVYDDTRAKWLSSYRTSLHGGERGRAKNKYLLVVDGQALNLSGWRIPRDATLTAISAQTRSAFTWTLRVRKNGSPTNIASLVMTAAAGAHDTSIDVDLDEGDQLQLYAETTSFFGVKDPLVWVEVAWRNDTLAMP